jgi:hypothetical protein
MEKIKGSTKSTVFLHTDARFSTTVSYKKAPVKMGAYDIIAARQEERANLTGDS